MKGKLPVVRQKDMVVNAVLLLSILVLAYAIVSSRYREPKQLIDITDEKVFNEGDLNGTNETSYKMTPSLYTHFGKKETFKSLVPSPTKPTPRPRTPTPTPPLNVVIKRWKLTMVLKDQVMVNDGKEDITLKLNETHNVQYAKVTVPVKLISIDMNTWSATFEYKDQKEVKKFF